MTMAAFTNVRVAIVILSQAYFDKLSFLEIDHAAIARFFQGFLSGRKL